MYLCDLGDGNFIFPIYLNVACRRQAQPVHIYLDRAKDIQQLPESKLEMGIY